MARFGEAEVMGLFLDGGAAAAGGGLQRYAWNQGSNNTIGLVTSGVMLIGGVVGAGYTGGTTARVLRAASQSAAAVLGWVTVEKMVLGSKAKLARGQRAAFDQVEHARAISGARDSVNVGTGSRKLLFSVTR